MARTHKKRNTIACCLSSKSKLRKPHDELALLWLIFHQEEVEDKVRALRKGGMSFEAIAVEAIPWERLTLKAVSAICNPHKTPEQVETWAEKHCPRQN
jgi:hypothetical protein